LRAVRSLVRHGGTRVRDAKAALLAMDYPIRTVMPAKAGAKRVGEGSERGGEMPEYAPAPPGGGRRSAPAQSRNRQQGSGSCPMANPEKRNLYTARTEYSTGLLTATQFQPTTSTRG